MLTFLLLAHDYKDAGALERRMKARESHLALGQAMQEKGELLYAAALLSDTGVMTGSCMIVNFPTREALDHWLSHEPYVTSRVWESVDVQRCSVGPGFLKNMLT